MQFKHPEILYTLLALLIPILVHLFQFRKFKKVPFTNVAFLKNVTQQNRKSSQLKKWIILTLRMLAIAAIVFAFAQPYFSKNQSTNQATETVVYLDNSFSLQVKGKKGALLKTAIQELVEHLPEEEEFSLLTNSSSYKNTTLKAIKNDLLQLDYSPNQLAYKTAFLKCKKMFSTSKETVKRILFISDFQQKEQPFTVENDSVTQVYAIALKPETTKNSSIDSVYVKNKTATTIDFSVVVKNRESSKALPVSLYNNAALIGKSNLQEDEEVVTFSVPANAVITGELRIEDTNLTFDNSLFFNTNTAAKIKVLTITAANDNYLKRLFDTTEFDYTASSLKTLQYSSISKMNFIVLNELESIPEGLQTALQTFLKNGGSVLLIPATKSFGSTYNSFLQPYTIQFNKLVTKEKKVTFINYENPLYKNVFEKKISNFQYPKVQNYFRLNAASTRPILAFEDNAPFLINSDNLYVFSAALNAQNSNFIKAPLIVPTIYNIAKQSLKIPQLYYTIGKENTYEIATNLPEDAIVSLHLDAKSSIPLQRYFNNKVTITTTDNPDIAGIYALKKGTEFLQNVSYNYNREENNLQYQNIENQDHIILETSIANVLNTLKSTSKINSFWKWFVIFAIVFLILELLVLKFF